MIAVHVMNTWNTITEHPKKSLKVALLSFSKVRGVEDKKREAIL
jgi:hypothetical protein